MIARFLAKNPTDPVRGKAYMEKKNEVLKNADSSSVARAAVAVLIEKKARGVRLYNVGEKSPITDFYVNVTGGSLNQVAALADEVAEKLSEMGKDAERIEGKRGNSWILVDYGDVIVNIFDKESREFYNLDRLMPPESEVDISDIEREVDEKLKTIEIVY